MVKLQKLIPLLFLYTSVYSQGPVQVFTPNAATLGQYGQVPVNYFNGLPEISIPLTTFKAKGYELLISLTYHASGHNPDSHPGWVGLGWSLHAGGMINRIIKGYKDEKSEKEFQYLSDVSYGDSQSAYYYHAEQMQANNWSDETHLSEINSFSAAVRPLGTEPDEFQVCVDDIQASFYIVGINKVKIKSKTNVNFKADIKLDTSNSTYVLYKNSQGSKNMESSLFTYISEIVITKDNGIKYYFGGDINTIEFSFVHYPRYALDNTINTNEWKSIGTANSWLLKKIELPNGEAIEFTYEKSGTPIVVSDSHYGEAYVLDGNSGYGSLFDTKQYPSKYNNLSFTFIQPSYLKSIKSKITKNEIFFNKSKSQELEYDITKSIFEFRVGNFRYFDPMSEGEFSYEKLVAQNYYMKLDEIVEKSKRISLEYSNDPLSRLKLSSVSFSPNNGWQISKYSLLYNSFKLPSYNSKKTDKWGYYNNKYYGNTNYENLGTYRTPNANSMQAEMLIGIIYPTGGQSEFIYEAHNYSRVAEQFDFVIKPKLGTAGGLRIKEIKTKENGKITTREFEYTDSLGNSSGILSGNHLYYASGRQHVKFHYGRWWGLVYMNIKVDYKATYYIMQESNINQLSTTSGNHVTYSRIVEKFPDGSKTIYKYSNHDDFMDETPVKMIDNINSEVLSNSFISKELERGLLLKTEYIDKNELPLKTEIYQYNSSPDRYNDFVKSINQMVLVGGNIRRISALKLYTFYPYMESKTTIIRDSLTGKSITSITRFEYNTNKLPSKTSTANSKSEEEFIVMRYVGDMQNGICTQMKDRNMLSLPVEKTTIRNNKVINSELSTYRKNETSSDYIPDKIYNAKFSTPLPYGQFVHFDGISKDSHYILPEIEYTKYDRNSNIEEFITKDFQVATCTWGYDSQYPIALFEGARNDYKVTPQYQDVWFTESIALKHNASYQNTKTYNFYTSQYGSVEFLLSGALGYNWYVTGRLDGKAVQLIQIRTNNKNEPWWRYENAYSYKVVINGVSAGYHTFRIDATDSYKDTSIAGDYDGTMYLSYWKSQSIAPEITGNDDVFYQNFEDFYASDVVPFGFHSSKSYTGPYTVTLPTNPNKNYTIDYQVFKNGKWCYSSADFENGAYTINEGSDPIDEVRVYPKDATVTSCTYIPFIGMRSKTNERGCTESYEYDFYGRLAAIKGNNEEFIKAFDYKYYNQSSEIVSTTYYNVEIKKEFIKESCDSLLGEIGQPIEYIVPARKYSSTISQEDANRKAYEDLVRNGQQYANEHGECSNNIVLSVYNPFDVTYVLNFCWGVQGSLSYDLYSIPPSEKIADTGDVLQDYKPVIVHLPRYNYRYVDVDLEGGYPTDIDLSIKSSEYGFDLFYGIEYYPDYRDTYVIGGYPFSY